MSNLLEREASLKDEFLSVPPLDQRLGPEHQLNASEFPDALDVISDFDRVIGKGSVGLQIADIALVAVHKQPEKPWYLTKHLTEDDKTVRSTLIPLVPNGSFSNNALRTVLQKNRTRQLDADLPRPKRAIFKVVSLIGEKFGDLTGEWHIYEMNSFSELSRESQNGEALTHTEKHDLRALKTAERHHSLELNKRFVVDGSSVTVKNI